MLEGGVQKMVEPFFEHPLNLVWLRKIMAIRNVKNYWVYE
jgi:hypothetical protein